MKICTKRLKAGTYHLTHEDFTVLVQHYLGPEYPRGWGARALWRNDYKTNVLTRTKRQAVWFAKLMLANP